MLSKEAAAVAFVHDAFSHLKVIGHSAEAKPLMDKAGVVPDKGVIAMKGHDASGYLHAAAEGRIWPREPTLRTVF